MAQIRKDWNSRGIIPPLTKTILTHILTRYTSNPLYSRYLDVKYSDTLLAVVTCSNDDRLVLVARRQRGNETQADFRYANMLQPLTPRVVS